MNAVEIEQTIADMSLKGARALQDRLTWQWSRCQVRPQVTADHRSLISGRGQVGIDCGVASFDKVLSELLGLAKLNYSGLGGQSIRALKRLDHAFLTPTT